MLSFVFWLVSEPVTLRGCKYKCVCVYVVRDGSVPDKLAGVECESKAWSGYLTALSGDSLWTQTLSLTDCRIMETKDSCCSL